MPKTYELLMDGERWTFKELARIKDKLHEGHKADGICYTCCDFRFRDKNNQFLNGLDNGLFDIFSVPGSYTMAFLGPEYGHPDGEEYFDYWTEKMLPLHHTNRILLTAHGKGTGRCGAYASTPSLAGKSDEEMYRLQLKDARKVQQKLKRKLPEAEVLFLYIEYEERDEVFTYSLLESIEPLAAAV